MTIDEHNIEISFCIDDNNENNTNAVVNIDELMNTMNTMNTVNTLNNMNGLNNGVNVNDIAFPLMLNYQENFTVKELMLICEYYGFAKNLKTNKYNKEQIIEILVAFECNETNMEIVIKRQNMWHYMNELKNDKFMKKFVIW
jgi:hypothetical protein